MLNIHGLQELHSTKAPKYMNVTFSTSSARSKWAHPDPVDMFDGTDAFVALVLDPTRMKFHIRPGTGVT